MNLASWLLLAAILAAAFIAVLKITKGQSGSCRGCGGCFTQAGCRNAAVKKRRAALDKVQKHEAHKQLEKSLR